MPQASRHLATLICGAIAIDSAPGVGQAQLPANTGAAAAPLLWGLTAPIATTLAACIALFGVVIGLLWNGWMADRTRRAAAAHEVRVVRASLMAELTSLLKIVTEEIDHLERYNFTWVPMLDVLSLYRTDLNKVGLLQEREVSAISTAYYSYHERLGYIARRGGIDMTKPYLGTNATFAFGKRPSDQQRKADVIEDLRGIVPSAEAALRILTEAGRP